VTVQSELKYLQPKPSPFKLIRLGGNKDGSYLVPDDLSQIDACFSPGVEDRKYFEDELTIRYGIKCHLCDFSTDEKKLKTPLIKPFQTFEKKWLKSKKDKDSITLKEWVRNYSPISTNDLILQMDIEGAEYDNILNADKSLINRFRIILIELHGLTLHKKNMNLDLEKLRLINYLKDTHVCIHAHPNNNCMDSIDIHTSMNIPEVLELTYLRKDRFQKNVTQKTFKPLLPHPLDITSNKILPPLHLNEQWLLENRRDYKSRMKILNDYINYYIFLSIYRTSKPIEKLFGKNNLIVKLVRSVFHSIR